jgi:hypothetical protein
MHLSADLTIMFSPKDAYRRFAALPVRDRWFVVGLRRPAFVALLIGSMIAMTATDRIGVGLVLSVGLCWSFATVVQTAAAAGVIAAFPGRIVGGARALDLFFMSAGPWSLWLLTLGAWAGLAADHTAIPRVALATAAVPIVWTAVIVFAFCRSVLNASFRGALTATLIHQAAIWIFTAVYISTAVQAWPRLLGALGK